MNDMRITIEDVINTPELKTRLIAGEQGKKNNVQWAHVCEVSDPTEWLGIHDLLMTVGLAIPAGIEEQQQYILRLIDAKIAGLMIGENMSAPDDLSNLLKVADENNFPILMTHYDVPFAAVTKMIMNSRHQLEFERNRSIAKLYEYAQSGLKGIETKKLIDKINTVLDVEIYLIDLNNDFFVFGESEALPQDIKLKLNELKKQRINNYNVVKKIKINIDNSLYILSTSFYDFKLLIRAKDLDYSLIHHISAILSIDLERKNFEFERKMRIGSEIIHDILEKRITNYQVEVQLKDYGIEIDSAVLMLVKIKENLNFESFLFINKISVLLKRHRDQYIFIVNKSDFDILKDMISIAGVSNPLIYLDRFSSAFQEAKLAYKHCEIDHPVQFYEKIINHIPWLPNDINEAKQIFERYIGVLVYYDKSQGTSHIKTLKIFLDHDCSWEKTARALNIHKQTLVYRINKIQSLIGRNLSKTEDVAIIWMAMRCLDIFNK